MILTPRKATFLRWHRLSRISYSVLRALEYEAIQGLRLQGKTLDIGGGKNTSYLHLLKIQGTLHSINLGQSTGPSIRADANHALPIRSCSYDNILSLNTIEHLKNDVPLLKEMHRVLDKSGRLYIIVPFLYRVHGSPADYHRHTASWWEEMLSEIGFSDVVIDPLVWDPRVSGFSISELAYRQYLPWLRVWHALKRRFLFLRSTFSHLRYRGKRLPDSYRVYLEYALGYWIQARKAGESR